MNTLSPDTLLCEWCDALPDIKIPALHDFGRLSPVIVRCPKCGVYVASGYGAEKAVKLWNQLQAKEREENSALWRKAMRDYYRDRERT